MNREGILNYLLAYLSNFSYHSRLIYELIDIIAASGYEKKFFKLLVARLRHLSVMGIEATKHTEFEPLGNGLYSMHMSSTNFNIRILYSFLSNGQPVLLLPFFERAGKKNTDYTPYIKPALSRLAEMKEDFNNEF